MGQQKRFFPPRDGVDCKKSISLIHNVDPEFKSPTGDPIKQRPRQHAGYEYSRVLLICISTSGENAILLFSLSKLTDS